MLENQTKQRNEMFDTALLALSVGIIQHILFYGQAMGISYPIFVGVLYAFLYWGLRHQVRHGLDLAYMLLVPIAFLSLIFFISSNPILHILNFLVLPFLIVTQTMRMGDAKRQLLVQPFHYFGGLVKQMIVRGFSYFPQPFLLFMHILRKRTGGSQNRSLMKVGMGLLLTLPLLIVVVPLLASADTMFQEQISNWQELFYKINLSSFLFRTIWIAVVSSYLFSYLWTLKHPRATQVKDIPDVDWGDWTIEAKQPIALDATVALTVLVVVNAVYLLFTIVQFSYFFAAGDGILPDGTNYAEYARRGFAELVLVTMINFSLLLGGIHRVKVEGNTRVVMFLKVMLSMLVGSTVVMLISAHLRLAMYEEAYGYTTTRILVHAFMIFLAVLLLLSLVRVWMDRMRLLKPFVLVSLVAWLLINYINIDVIIAKNNLQRYTLTGKIDLSYFDSLSYDMIPYLVHYNEISPHKPEGLEDFLLDTKQELDSKNQGWQAFNLSQFRATKALKHVK
jgi:hypothetical protein